MAVFSLFFSDRHVFEIDKNQQARENELFLDFN